MAKMDAAYLEARRALAESGLSEAQMPMIDSWLRDALKVMEKDPELVKKLTAMTPKEAAAAGQDPEVIKRVVDLLKPQKVKRRGRFGH